LCRIDIAIDDNEAIKNFDLEFTVLGPSHNNNRFYLIDKNADGNSATELKALDLETINTLTIDENNRFQLLTIFDFSNEDIQTKIRYGIPVEKVECNIRFDYEGGLPEYIA